MHFVVRLGTPDGRVREEQHEAADAVSLRNDLERRGLHVFELRQHGLTWQLPRLRGRRRRIPDQDFLVFNQEVAALLRAGLPLLQALDLLLQRMPNPHFKAVLSEIRDRVKSGEELSDAFGAFGPLFPSLYPSTLKAGEKSGELEAVIRRFIRYLKLLIDARKRVASALVYPAVLVTLSIAMISVMLVFVIPKFKVFYVDMGAELPMLTVITLAIGTFLRDNLILILVGIGAGVVFLRQWSATPTGGQALDRFRLRIPLVGGIFHRFAIAELTRSLSTLLAGGIPLVPALEIAVKAVGNTYIRAQLLPTIDKVREGQAFFKTLEESRVVDALAVDMVQVGEATGALDTMLSSVADFLDDEVETRLQRILTLIEPLMLVFMGIIVGTLLVSVYLPMFSVLGQMK
jgi:type IV pilus assembly protein PilC